MAGDATCGTPPHRPSPCLQPTPAIYREAQTQNVTRAVIAVHDISDTHCLGSCALTTDKKNRIMQAIVSQLSPLSTSVRFPEG